MEKQSITYTVSGFNTEAFSDEKTELTNDDVFDAIRVYKNGNGQLCFEFFLIDREIGLENSSFLAFVRIRCEEYLNSISGLAYRYINTSRPLEFKLSHACGPNNLKMAFESATFSTEFSGVCGVFNLHEYAERLQKHEAIFLTIAGILRTDNPAFKYLLLYENLQSSFKDQTQTDKFIKGSRTWKRRSLKDKECKQRTSDPTRQDKKETEITYIRNAFAHPDVSHVDALNSYTNSRLDDMTKALIELIYEKNGCL